MYTDEDVESFLADLSSDDPQMRIDALRVLVGNPSGDRHLLARLWELLDDRTVSVLTIPFTYGEVRWVAAEALEAESRVRGIDGPVIADIPYPLGSDEIYSRAEEAGIEEDSAAEEGVIGMYSMLRDRGLIPIRNIRF